MNLFNAFGEGLQRPDDVFEQAVVQEVIDPADNHHKQNKGKQQERTFPAKGLMILHLAFNLSKMDTGNSGEHELEYKSAEEQSEQRHEHRADIRFNKLPFYGHGCRRYSPVLITNGFCFMI